MARGKGRKVGMNWVEKDLVNQSKGVEIYSERNEELQFKKF